MALTELDVTRIARLARIEIANDQTPRVLNELNQIFNLIEQLQSIDTQDITPLSHPLAAIQAINLRLRDDIATEPSSTENRTALMSNAPAQEQALFLVPKVIE